MEKWFNLGYKKHFLGEWSVHFTLKQLRYVEAAGRLRSIAKAAEELAISQSSITAAIDQLEFNLGYDLFVRTPAKGIQPTPAGKDALEMMRGFLQQATEFETELLSIGGDTAGVVRIACYATAAPAFLPPILRDITENFPSMSIQVMEGTMTRIMEFLDEGLADLAFTYEEVTNKSHVFQTLFEAPPYALISNNDPLSRGETVTVEELAARPMVLLDLPRTRDYFVEIFTKNGLKPNIAHTSRSAEIVRALVDGGFGYTILNIRTPQARSENHRAVPIKGPHDNPQFGIATMAHARRPTIVTSFIERCLALEESGAFNELRVWGETSKK